MIQEKKRVLGRGLESLIPAARRQSEANTPGPANTGPDRGTHAAAVGEVVQEIALEEIAESPYQPRRHQRDEAALQELAQSIRAQGVLQPIVVRYISPELRVDVPHPSKTGLGGPPAVDRGKNVDGRWSMVDGPEQPHLVSPTAGETRVRHPANDGEQPHPISPNPGEIRVGQPGEHGSETRATQAPATQTEIKYQLIAGERRWLASRMAGRKTVPAIVRQVSNEQAMEMALIENLQREDLDCLEMAYAFERLSQEFKLTQEEMAKKTGKDRGTIANLLRLLKLPPEVRAALARRDLSFGHAKELMSLEDQTVMIAAAQRVMREGLSVRQTEELVNHLVYLGPVSEKDWKERQKQARQKAEDPNVKAARMELESRLGCRVKIVDKDGKGRVVIEYKSLEDFDRIVEALGK